MKTDLERERKKSNLIGVWGIGGLGLGVIYALKRGTHCYA